MEEDKIILFYSKYSEHSKKLFKFLEDKKLKINLVCVDNDIIRNKILKSNNIKINYIPTVLIKSNDSIAKYDKS